MKYATYSGAFCERLKEARRRRGLSQKQLAERSGLTLLTIQKIEGGYNPPKLDTLRQLSDGLDISADYLLGRTKWREKSFASRSQNETQSMSGACASLSPPRVG